MDDLAPYAAFVAQQEGCRLTAYPDVGGVLTIGYGHTGQDVTPGLNWTQAQADAALQSDLAGALACVQRFVDVALSLNQSIALVDFVFNLGCDALRTSTLLLDLNGGNYTAAAEQFQLWCHATIDGELQVVPDLVARRAAEKTLFLKAQ